MNQIAVVLAVLSLRDAYVDPATRSQKEAVTHEITASAAAFVLEALMVVVAPQPTVPRLLMMRGTAISMMTISGWRLTFI